MQTTKKLYSFCIEWCAFLIKVFIKALIGGFLFVFGFFLILGFYYFSKYLFLNYFTTLFIFCSMLIIYFISGFTKEHHRQKSLKELQNLKKEIVDLINPNKMYERLKTDILQVRLNENLLDMINNENNLMKKIISLRLKLTDKYGYIIPGIRALDDIELNPFEYQFFISEAANEKGVVYPNKILVKKSDLEFLKIDIPEKSITALSPIDQTEVIWVEKRLLPQDKDIEFIEPFAVIINHLEKICINNADKIISLEYVQKLLDHIENKVYEKTLLPSILSIVDLQKILINLVKKRISIKNIKFILEKLADYARYTKNIDELTEKIIIDLEN